MFQNSFKKNISFFRDVLIFIKSNYRVKNKTCLDSPSHIEKEFIKRIIKTKPNEVEELIINGSVSKLKSLGLSLNFLSDNYKILYLGASEISRRYQLIKDALGDKNINLEMITNAKYKKITPNRKQILLNLVDSENKMETLKKALGCSEEEFLKILIRNPRLGGRKKNLDFLPKIKLLLKNGADINQLKKNTSLLNNKTYNELIKRVSILSSLNYNKPLPLGLLGRTDKFFKQVCEKIFENSSIPLINNPSISSVNLETSSGPTHRLSPLELLSLIPHFQGRPLYRHVEKIKYLYSVGYSSNDILATSWILTKGLDKIKQAVEHFQQFHCSLVPLSLCLKYLITKSSSQVSHRSGFKFQFQLLNSLNLSCDFTFFKLTENLKKTSITARDVISNFNFLEEKGLEKYHIKNNPEILFYSHHHLLKAWEKMEEEENIPESLITSGKLQDNYDEFSSDNERLQVYNIKSYDGEIKNFLLNLSNNLENILFFDLEEFEKIILNKKRKGEVVKATKKLFSTFLKNKYVKKIYLTTSERIKENEEEEKDEKEGFYPLHFKPEKHFFESDLFQDDFQLQEQFMDKLNISENFVPEEKIKKSGKEEKEDEDCHNSNKIEIIYN